MATLSYRSRPYALREASRKSPISFELLCGLRVVSCRFRVMRPALFFLLLSLAACPEPLPIDAATFTCRTHADCGSGAFCDHGLCRLFGAPSPDASEPEVDAAPAPDVTVPACEVPLTAARTSEDAVLTLETDPVSGKRLLRIRLDGIDTTYPVPDDVIDFDDGADRCCEDPCCQLLGPPP